MSILDFLLQHVALVALVLASALMLAWPEIQALISREQAISPVEATQMINRRHALVIDLRSREHYDLGHLPTAHSIHPDELSSEVGSRKLPTEHPVILIASTQNTARAAATLKTVGFSDIYVLKGGMTAWVEANLPLAHAPLKS